MIVSIVLHILKREVFELALKFIKTQLMSQWSIEISGLLRHLHLSLDVLGIAYLAHQVYTIGNHDEDNAHILGKREQQVTKILAFNGRILIVELFYAIQSVKYSGNRLAMSLLHFIEGNITCLDFRNKLNSLYGIAFKTNLLSKDLGRLLSHPLLLFVCKCKFFCHN